MPGERGRMGPQGTPVSCILPALYFKSLLIGKKSLIILHTGTVLLKIV